MGYDARKSQDRKMQVQHFLFLKAKKVPSIVSKIFKLTIHNVNSYVGKKKVLHFKPLIILLEVLDIRSQKMCCCHTYEHGCSSSDLRPVALEELDD